MAHAEPMRSPCGGPTLHEHLADLVEAPTDRPSTVVMQGPSLAPNVSEAGEARVPLVETEDRATASEDHPGLPPYDLVWKITKIKRKTPGVFWKDTLKRRLAKVSNEEGLHRDGAVASHAIVIISLSGRPGRKIERRSPRARVDWEFVEAKLGEWASLHSQAKVLKVELVVNFETKLRGKNKAGSASQRMRAECDDLLPVQEASAGATPSWPATYQKFRCTAVGCSGAGHYCWCEPLTGQHHTLQPQDLQELGKRGITTHGSVPKELGDVLQKRCSSHRKRKAGALGLQAIEVAQSPAANTSRGTHVSMHSAKSPISQSYSSLGWALGCVGLEEMVNAYSQWHQGRTNNASWILDTQKAAEVSIDEELDLKQIGHEVGHEFFVQRGVKEGTARRWVGEVSRWIKIKQADFASSFSSPVLL
ncbi:hypothetical protein LTR37_015911 [Vermiconidia calcicola]|uniref:Uncharacterized protein n=1 Tax=Vermiconidia calcicola TaxID=1690605 RepID=A0ACC3MP93_9PEZI|nr:hypothetical protein LTR37_015911 [Vermiconidia calcicola]